MILFVPVRPLATDSHGEMCRKDMGRESVALFKEFPSQIFLHDAGEVLAFSDDPAVRIDRQGVSIGVHKMCEAIEYARSGGFSRRLPIFRLPGRSRCEHEFFAWSPRVYPSARARIA
ncbi:hypothetical protein [Streptomyces sp. NPDC002758]